MGRAPSMLDRNSIARSGTHLLSDKQKNKTDRRDEGNTEMAVCSYCGDECGWLGENHPKCVEPCKAGISFLRAEIEGAMLGGRSFADVDISLQRRNTTYFRVARSPGAVRKVHAIE